MDRLGFTVCAAIGVAALLTPRAADAATFKTLYSFANAGNGANPVGGLITAGRYLYGVASGGGAASFGAVFRVNRKTGAETVVYNFAGIPDGRQPFAALTNIHGTLYGTTYLGGAGSYPSGTVFSIDPNTGAEAVLHSFSGGSGGSDGGEPESAMVNVGGILYGTTVIGGPENSGTVFSVDPATGTETILHTFDVNNGEGFAPGGLLNVHGTLYGTADGGGSGCGGSGCGLVFKIDVATGTFTVVYAFAGGSDAASPSSGALIKVGRTLYGTSTQGGGTGCGLQVGCGTVFSIDARSGAEAVVYGFAGDSDGQSPSGSVTNVAGTLYGATALGGDNNCGTLFSVDPGTGAKTTLYTFTGGADGSSPVGRLIARQGVLYGEAYTGGAAYGTVFQLTP